MNLNVDKFRTTLCDTFCRSVGVFAQGENEIAIHLPYPNRDGDHATIYLSPTVGGWKLSDKGVTMMRLSYENDLDRLLSGSRVKLLESVLNENGVFDDDGELHLEVPADQMLSGLFMLSQAITRIEDLSMWTKNRVESVFYEDLNDLVLQVALKNNIEIIENYIVPDAPNSANYPVDYFLKTKGKPLYLFGVLNKDKARLTTIILQYLSLHTPSFDSIVVCSDMDVIPKSDMKRLLATANDLVPSIEDKSAITQKIEHRLAA